MASLYELTEQELQLNELLSDEVIDSETFMDTLESLDIESKIESIIKFIKNSEADALIFKTEKKKFEDKQKQAENRVVRLKQLITDYMKRTDKKKAIAGLFTVSRVDKDTVEITDETLIPKKYFEQIEKLNKTLLNKDAIDKSIKGTSVISKSHIRIK